MSQRRLVRATNPAQPRGVDEGIIVKHTAVSQTEVQTIYSQDGRSLEFSLLPQATNKSIDIFERHKGTSLTARL